MRVAILPDWRDVNPYQQLLADALGQLGVDVDFPQGYRRGLPIWRALRAGSAPDILHLHWPSAYLRSKHKVIRTLYCIRVFIDLWLVRKSGISIVWTVHNLVTHDTPTPGAEKWLSGRLARLADQVIVHNEAARDEIVQTLNAPQDRIVIIPHGSFRTQYGELPPRETARSELGIEHDQPVILFFGLIRPYKGVPALLDAWEALGERRGEALLIVAGNAPDPEYAAEIQAHASRVPQVRLDMRFLPDEDMLRLLAASDALVLPFQNSLTSGTVRLAQDYGLPVVVPQVPGSADAQGAIMARDTGPEALGEAILDALARPAPEQGDDGPGWDGIAAQHREIYEAALEGKRT